MFCGVNNSHQGDNRDDDVNKGKVDLSVCGVIGKDLRLNLPLVTNHIETNVSKDRDKHEDNQ